MELKSRAGPVIRIIQGEHSKLLTFSNTVRLVELSTQEAQTLGSALNRDAQTSVTPAIRALKDQEFFDKPRRFGEIKNELRKRGYSVKLASLNVVLAKLVDRHELTRKGQPGNYIYKV